MKLLHTKPNTVAPGGDYPFGNMRDDDGSGNGSLADTQFMTDYVQFFEKMMFDSGLTANGLPDNTANGFQLMSAFKVFNPLKKKIVPIGVWNMDTTPSVTIAHGIPDHLTIRTIEAVIHSDIGDLMVPLSADGTVGASDATNTSLSRVTGGGFDTSAFSSGGGNRGYVIIGYTY